MFNQLVIKTFLTAYFTLKPACNINQGSQFIKDILTKLQKLEKTGSGGNHQNFGGHILGLKNFTNAGNIK